MAPRGERDARSPEIASKREFISFSNRFFLLPISGSVAGGSFDEAPERQPGELWPPGETNTDTHEMKF